MKITFDFEDVNTASKFLLYANKFFDGSVKINVEENTPGTGDKAPEEENTPGTGDKAPEEDKPTSRRRGRSAKKEEKPTSRRRGRSAKKEEESKDSDTVEDISDAEASKAASEAAKELDVEVVLEELHHYKVDKVSELDQPQRREFMGRLRELLNQPEEEKKPW